MNTMYLSKSKYCAGRQCPKILWLKKNKPEVEDLSVKDECRLSVGNEVGSLAAKYFGEFAEVPFDAADTNNFGNMVAFTEQLISRGETVIAEASFQYDGNFCSVDILRKVNGGWELIEVKSSSSEEDTASKPPKNIYLDDMAYQYYVVSKNGINIVRASLMRLNSKYVRSGELDLEKLFVLSDFTAAIKDKQQDIESNIERIRAVAVQANEPDIAIGTRREGEEYGCKEPYDCGFRNYCWRHLPKPNVYDIGFGMWGVKKDSVYNDGIISFKEIFESKIALNAKQQRQVESTLYNQSSFVDKTAIKGFLSTVKYPLYHLDFETIQQVIPLWNGIWPYRQIPFQYSLHIQSEPCVEPLHKEFLAKEGTDPRRALAERLCVDIPTDVCVIAYHAAFEKMVVKQLADDFPDLRKHLIDIGKNILDLEIPFKNGWYYADKMNGHSSIKYVLPALFPNDPVLDYKKLDELVQNGSQAMTVFPQLHKQNLETIERIRNALIAYCKLDTLAMVKVLQKLYEATS